MYYTELDYICQYYTEKKYDILKIKYLHLYQQPLRSVWRSLFSYGNEFSCTVIRLSFINLAPHFRIFDYKNRTACDAIALILTHFMCDKNFGVLGEASLNKHAAFLRKLWFVRQTAVLAILEIPLRMSLGYLIYCLKK